VEIRVRVSEKKFQKLELKEALYKSENEKGFAV